MFVLKQNLINELNLANINLIDMVCFRFDKTCEELNRVVGQIGIGVTNFNRRKCDIIFIYKHYFGGYIKLQIVNKTV